MGTQVDLSDPLASALFDSSPDGIVIVDETGEIVLANRVRTDVRLRAEVPGRPSDR
jgi:PAS domain-containing protein